VANLRMNKNMKATIWTNGVKEGQFIDFQDHLHQRILLFHKTDTKEDKASSNKLFGRSAYEHFKNRIDMCMMHQDVSVAIASQRQWCCLHLTSGTCAATSN
jgi:hypothetical protein